MNLEQAVHAACGHKTLNEALTFICVWESERVVAQAIKNHDAGTVEPNGQKWETCFATCIRRVLAEYKTPERELIRNYIEALLAQDSVKAGEATKEMVNIIWPTMVKTVLSES